MGNVEAPAEKMATPVAGDGDGSSSRPVVFAVDTALQRVPRMDGAIPGEPAGGEASGRVNADRKRGAPPGRFSPGTRRRMRSLSHQAKRAQPAASPGADSADGAGIRTL